MRGRGRLEGNALAAAGSYVGGRGSNSVGASANVGGQAVVPMPRGGAMGGSLEPNVGGHAVVPMPQGGVMGGPVEVKARVSVPGRSVNGARGTAVYAGSRFRRSVKERLGSVEQSDDSKAETNKVGGHISIFTCYVLNFRCL